MFPPSLHVNGSQVHSEFFPRFLKQVVCDLLSYSVVKCLGDLIYKPRHVGVRPASLVEVIGLLQHLRESLAADEPVALTPSKEER